MAIQWPLTGRITSPFGDTYKRRSPHSGDDIGGTGAIRAGATGVVHHVGPNPAGPNSGNVVTIKYKVSGGTLYSMYCHVQARYPVRVGQTVTAGQIIAYVGSSGTGDGGHVHIECYLNGRLVRPSIYFGGVVSAGGGTTPIPATPAAPKPQPKEDLMDMVHFTKKVVDVPGISGVRHATWKDEYHYLVFSSTWYKKIVGSGTDANNHASAFNHGENSRPVTEEVYNLIVAQIDSLPKPGAVELTDADLAKVADLVVAKLKFPTKGSITLS